MLNERLLQYIWQFRYFSTNELATTSGEPLCIIHPGQLNTNQGPDFLDAKIKIGTTTWAGSIELHTRSSEWNEHKHSGDPKYRNVILHVVWEEDTDLNMLFPTLELHNKVSKLLLKKYDELMNNSAFIPCENNIQQIEMIILNSWKERLLVERLQSSTERIAGYLQENNNHWEEVFWWMLARNFGMKVNSDAFEKMAVSLPVNILAKHKGRLHQIEALLFGQTGLLENNFIEDYPNLLKKEFQFLRKKYAISPVKIPLQFLRMRPSNFPTIRLAQLAMLIHKSLHLFSKIKESSAFSDIKRLLEVSASDYWDHHYILEEQSVFRKKQLGEQMINNILINTVVPILFAYGHLKKESKYKERAIKWMQHIPEEKNIVTSGFGTLGIEAKNAFDSQALLQLKNNYCNQKRCLECAIGNKLIPPKSS